MSARRRRRTSTTLGIVLVAVTVVGCGGGDPAPVPTAAPVTGPPPERPEAQAPSGSGQVSAGPLVSHGHATPPPPCDLLSASTVAALLGGHAAVGAASGSTCRWGPVAASVREVQDLGAELTRYQEAHGDEVVDALGDVGDAALLGHTSSGWTVAASTRGLWLEVVGAPSRALAVRAAKEMVGVVAG